MAGGQLRIDYLLTNARRAVKLLEDGGHGWSLKEEIMGWWSDTIMGGDSPLDFLAVIGEVVGAKFDYEDERTPNFHGYHFTRGQLERRGVAAQLIRKAPNWERTVYFQTIGAVYLWAGAKMTAALRGEVIRGAKQDEWMKEEGSMSSRGRHVQTLIRLVEKHWKGGVQVELKDEGLMQKFAEAGII